jgi:competence protein ComEA
MPMKTLGVLTLLLPAIAICFALSTARAVEAQADKLPEAPGKATVVAVCTSCHGSEVMTDAPRTVAGWVDVMFLMKDFGAMATEAEWKTVTDYVVANLALLEVNKAEAAHMQLVFGLSEAAAKDVIAYRDKQGGFKTIDDLKNAPGVDAAKIDALKERLLFR